MTDETAFRKTRMLRLIGTGQYFTGSGWSGNVLQAKTFRDSGEAVRVCVENGLINVELALRLNLSGPDLFCAPVR